MEAKLRALLADVFRVPESTISESLKMDDLDVWDSLKHMELITAIESEFAVSLTLEEILAMRSVQAIQEVLRTRS